jgi:hypothetical protein
MMIRKLLTTGIFLAILMPLAALSQNSGGQPADTIPEATRDSLSGETREQPVTNRFKRQHKRRTDTIFFFDAKAMHVDVMKITFDSVLYRQPGETSLQALDKDIIHKIKYNWGRLEILNEKPKEPQERLDWRKVEILNNPQQADGFHKVEEVTAKAKGSGRGFETPKSLENKARVILKKKAANLNAGYVLITNKTITTAFGEIPSATLTGTVYSRERDNSNQASGE